MTRLFSLENIVTEQLTSPFPEEAFVFVLSPCNSPEDSWEERSIRPE